MPRRRRSARGPSGATALPRAAAPLAAANGFVHASPPPSPSTVGKSWASLFDDRLPHGDPGATVSATPAPQSPLQGPIYFNESVTPDPMRTSTSVDGGVLFDNLPAGLVTLTASKAPFVYQPVRFRVDGSARLFISSPPHSLQSSNGSGPGLP